MCRSVVFAVLYYSTSMYSFISTRSSIQTVGCDENTNGEVWIKLRSNTGCEHEYESSFIILFCKVCNSCDSTDTNSIQNDGIMLSRNTKQTTQWLFRDEMKCLLKNNTIGTPGTPYWLGNQKQASVSKTSQIWRDRKKTWTN